MAVVPHTESTLRLAKRLAPRCALVGIELGSAADLDGLRSRMADSGLHVEALEPGSPAYRYLT